MVVFVWNICLNMHGIFCFVFVCFRYVKYIYVFFSSSGVEGFTSQEDQEMISRVEKQLKRRFAIGSQVSEHSIVQDFTKQVGGKRAALQFFGFFCFSMDVCYRWMILRG